MTRVILIRHGKTAGNLERRYVGRTDEPLCEQGIRELRDRLNRGIYPRAAKNARLFTSPMLRCVETASVLYPELEPDAVPDLRECDFGDFEYKNFPEMDGDPDYQKWVDSGGTAPFPGGEDPAEFRSRSVRAFQRILTENADCPQFIFVVHGGTVMSILSALGEPEAGYFDWQTDNGHGYVCELAGDGRLRTEGEF